MKGWYISVEKMTEKALTKFVRTNMPSAKELQRRMRLSGAPERCPKSGDPIADFVRFYSTVPTDDLTLRVKYTAGSATIIQLASGSIEMKYRLRAIVHRHLAKELRSAGHTIRCFVI